MFKAFTFKSLASLALIVAFAKKKRMTVPGQVECREHGGFEWIGKKSKKPMGGGEPAMRDHRKKMIFGIPAAN